MINPAATAEEDDRHIEAVIAASPEHIAQFFRYGHLKGQARGVSSGFALLAVAILELLPRNPERTVALRKLLEAKDAAVRASFAKDAPTGV